MASLLNHWYFPNNTVQILIMCHDINKENKQKKFAKVLLRQNSCYTLINMYSATKRSHTHAVHNTASSIIYSYTLMWLHEEFGAYVSIEVLQTTMLIIYYQIMLIGGV